MPPPYDTPLPDHGQHRVASDTLRRRPRSRTEPATESGQRLHERRRRRCRCRRGCSASRSPSRSPRSRTRRPAMFTNGSARARRPSTCTTSTRRIFGFAEEPHRPCSKPPARRSPSRSRRRYRREARPTPRPTRSSPLAAQRRRVPSPPGRPRCAHAPPGGLPRGGSMSAADRVHEDPMVHPEVAQAPSSALPISLPALPPPAVGFATTTTGTRLRRRPSRLMPRCAGREPSAVDAPRGERLPVGAPRLLEPGVAMVRRSSAVLISAARWAPPHLGRPHLGRAPVQDQGPSTIRSFESVNVVRLTHVEPLVPDGAGQVDVLSACSRPSPTA